jgi:hypothetical protein
MVDGCMKKLPIILFICLGLIGSISADTSDGWDKYQKGNFSSALEEFQKAAEQGDVIAQYALGLMYDNGEGVTQDNATAFKWYKKAAEQGYAQAQFTTGWMYANGRGVAKDYLRAGNWYAKAAEQGNNEAQQILTGLYGTGLGLAPSSINIQQEKIVVEEIVNDVDSFLAEFDEVEFISNTPKTMNYTNSNNVNQTVQMLQTQDRFDELQEQQQRAFEKQSKDFERMLEKQRKEMQRQQLYNNLLNNWTPVYQNKF